MLFVYCLKLEMALEYQKEENGKIKHLQIIYCYSFQTLKNTAL